jgi:hypothetical protein
MDSYDVLKIMMRCLNKASLAPGAVEGIKNGYKSGVLLSQPMIAKVYQGLQSSAAKVQFARNPFTQAISWESGPSFGPEWKPTGAIKLYKTPL